MTDAFAALDALLSGAVNAVFGETFRFEAFKAGDDVDKPRIADDGRATFVATAQWFAPTNSVVPQARGAQDDNAHRWTVGQPQILIDDAALLWRLQPGDRITRISTGETYTIGKPPRPDGMGHTTIPLTDRKR